MLMYILSAIALWAFIHGVAGVHPTDEYRDADPQQSGYLPNHNIDPAVVSSAQFGQLWKRGFNEGEQVRVLLSKAAYLKATRNWVAYTALNISPGDHIPLFLQL